MGLNDFFVPKWKHSKPEIRLAAINTTDFAPALLAEIVRTDLSPEVRIAALQKISDEAMLCDIAAATQDEQIRKTVQKMCETIYEKIIATSQDQSAVVSALEKYGKETAIATYMCRNPLDNALQTSLLKKINNPQLLCKISENECSQETGKTIVERIVEKEHLVRIAQKASSKKIRLLAQKKLEELFPDPQNEERKITHKLVTCLISIETISELHTIEEGSSLLASCREDWNQYDPNRLHPLAQKFTAAETQLSDRIARKTAMKATIEALVSLSIQAEALENDPVDSFEEKQADLQRQWNAIDRQGLSGGEFDTAFEKFTKATTAVRKKIAGIREERDGARVKNEAIEACCADLEKFISREREPDLREYNRIISKWENLSQTLTGNSPQKQRFIELQKKHDDKIAVLAEKKQRTAADEQEYIRRLFQNMEYAAAAAKPNQVLALYRDVSALKQKWGKQYPLAREEKKDLEAAFSQAYEQYLEKYHEFQEVHSWQEWANENIQAKICAEIEEYEVRLQQGDPVTNLSRRVSSFENQWKRSRLTSSEKLKELESRFDAACSRILDLGLAKKNELLESLKKTLTSEDDRDVSEEVKSIQKQWNDIGYLPPVIEKECADAFYSLCHTYFEERNERFQKYSQELHDNIALREVICCEAEKLADSDAWKETKAAFEELQKRWDASWPAPMKRSRELWQIISGYRDRFFERYDVFKNSNSEIKEELCKKAEELLAKIGQESSPVPLAPPNDGDQGPESSGIDHESSQINLNRILHEALELRRQWKESGPAARDVSETLWNRFNPAMTKVFEVINSEHGRNFALKEALVKEAESLTGSQEWEQTAQKFYNIRAEWNNIMPAARRDEQALWARLQMAGNVFFEARRKHFDDQKSLLNGQVALKESLLLDLELLIRIAGKTHLLKNTEVESSAEILKKGIALRNEIDVEGDPKKTADNIYWQVSDIVDMWNRGTPSSGKEYHRLSKRFNELLDILRER